MDWWLEEMCYDFHQSIGDGKINSTLGQSLFIQDIQEELIPTNFHLLLLKTFRGATDPMNMSLLFVLKYYIMASQIC